MRVLVLIAFTLLLAGGPARRSAGGQRPADAPTGEIVYSRKVGDRYLLHVMKADGTADRELPGQTAPFNLHPSWSPDGKRIVYQAGDDLQTRVFRIEVVNADGSGRITLDNPNTTNLSPCWSPDGRHVAFSAGQESPGIYISDIGAGGTRHLPSTGPGCVFPFWRRDGAAIGHTRLREEGARSRVVFTKLDGSQTDLIFESEKLTVSSADALSPDGKRLLYFEVDGPSRRLTLHLWEFADRVDSTILGPERYEPVRSPPTRTAAWSPDGRWALASFQTERGWATFRLSPDGKSRVRLTPEGIDCAGGSWRAATAGG